MVHQRAYDLYFVCGLIEAVSRAGRECRKNNYTYSAVNFLFTLLEGSNESADSFEFTRYLPAGQIWTQSIIFLPSNIMPERKWMMKNVTCTSYGRRLELLMVEIVLQNVATIST